MPSTFETSPHRVAVEHDVHREVLADVAEELDRRQLPGPRQVVLDDGAGGRVVELDEPFQLPPDPVGPVGDGVGGVTSFAGVARVTDHPGGAAGQHDRPVSGLLKAPQRQQWHQMAGVQARRGGIEARIDGCGSGGQQFGKRIAVGRLCDQSAPRQLVEDRRTHTPIFAYCPVFSR